MWKLVPLQSGGEPLYLLPGNEYVVGRKNCDILLGNDQSISRAHAQLSLSNQALTLKDNSKYGTFINDAQLATGTVQTLNSGDRLTFGVYQSKFKVEVVSLKVCSSCLDNERKAELAQALSSLGGRLVSSWDQECTHLVMPSVKVTIKTICALLCGRPIVKLEFFTVFSAALREKQSPPQAKSYYPEIDEPSLTKEDVDLSSRPERQRVFAEKTFIFLNSKQMKRLSQAVTCGGGQSQLLEEGSVPVSLLETSGSCVIDMASGSSQTLISTSTRKWIDAVDLVLHRRGLRWITESEIGLAAIYVSNSTYCNPCASTETETVRMKPVIPGPSLSQSTGVDETVLPAASQNITAYAFNTEPSQGISCPKVSEVTSVGETPEKQPSRARSTSHPRTASSSSSSSSSFQKPAVTRDRPASCTTITETMMSPLSAAQAGQSEKTRKAEIARSSKWPSGSDSAKFKAPQSSSNKSPQKQSSLTNFFLPANKKRARDGSTETSQSESKLFRLDSEDDELSKMNSTPAATHTAALNKTHATARKHTLTHSTTTTPAAQNQHRTLDSNQDRSSGLGAGLSASPSLGLGPGLSSGFGLGSSRGPSRGILDGVSSEFSLGQETKKRKEMAQEETVDPDLDLSLEELESLMSDDMDIPPEPTANKKQRLDQEEQSSASWKQTTKKDNGNASWQKSSEALKENTKNQKSERGKGSPANQKVSLECDKTVSANQKQKVEPKEGVKEEEVSFVVAEPNGNTSSEEGKASVKNSSVKEEQKESKPEVRSETDQDLPRGLLLVEFKSLVVSGPSRTRPEPLQSRNQNDKNFKKFRKVPVPGSQGLPQIIGGSDLVAHSRGKNTELEEWLKEAAEEEKQHEIEQAVGDELFRYNPKPVKKLWK
ncbi:nibrin [Clupea harengus]|uniref:Nibrin n=1 Tax=Clupea harengus TaxID=7950 RepID=A0A6P8FZM7_CLUHA|nr:nibrin [Clupea harengus]